MQTLSFLKEGLCRVADDPRDVAAARKPVVLPSQQQQQQPKRRGAAVGAAPDGFLQSQLLFPCVSPASAAAVLAGSGGNEGGVMELPDGTRLEAEQVAMKVLSKAYLQRASALWIPHPQCGSQAMLTHFCLAAVSVAQGA